MVSSVSWRRDNSHPSVMVITTLIAVYQVNPIKLRLEHEQVRRDRHGHTEPHDRVETTTETTAHHDSARLPRK